MERNEHLIKNKAIIELGCGRGLSGLACRLVTENSVVLTDLAPVIPTLKETIALNKLANIDAKALDWTNRKHGFPKFEVILAADVVWVYDLIEEFVTVLEELSSSTTTIYLAHQSRSNRADERLFNLLENKFLIQKTPREELEFNHSNVINIYQLKMK
ncbi:hypothetical protein HDV04_002757 [Boothiomyces sp. JEL0838]|nr:hypothetical protein HDV04_002757 [Boothiomyces sp. JEL0838]